ncbi:hypothetical protein [Niabella ginsengisoli]|uniref:Uncharacterized protein n=1 Tax=Niabella ginsengisoli TaxID=522298 RepID=A0ABS9SGX9_9BACT|nr:hypothetical protein [Niabella ginsengisoli]MCH5597627.1 hypothetical protein [Niabella ginsengisoli]
MRKIYWLLVFCIFFSGCSKALDVEEDMYFEQVNWEEPPGERDPIAGVAPMHLELKTSGWAGLYPGSGDIVWSGTYKITHRKVKVSLEHRDDTYEFEVKSDQELIGPGGEILHIKK